MRAVLDVEDQEDLAMMASPPSVVSSLVDVGRKNDKMAEL
jgi:hypothetical protein